MKVLKVSLLSSLVSTLALAQDAANTAAAAAPKAQPSFLEGMVPFLILLVAMYFIMIRPQVKKAKDQTEMIRTLQVGDEVVTTGGLIGRIRSLADNFVVLDLGSTTVKVLKEHITRLTFPKNGNTKAGTKESSES